MSKIEEIISREKANLNIHEYAFMKSNTVIFSDEVRRLCEKNVCGMYGTSWACPLLLEVSKSVKTDVLILKMLSCLPH